MKKSILFSICFFVLFQIIAKDYDTSRVPSKIRKKLETLYPNSRKEEVSWKKRFNKYQADFIDNNKSISLLFKKDGGIINYKTEINFSEVPSIISKEIKTDYLDKYYKIIYIMKRMEKEEVLYEVEVMKGRIVNVIRYNMKGEVTNIYDLDKRDILNMPSFPD